MLHLKITTPERTVFEDDVSQVTLPTSEGEITVLANHTPFISVLKPGELVFKKEEEEHFLAVAGGFVQVQPQSRVIILADSADWVTEIDEEKTKEAEARARKILEDKNLGEVEYAQAQTALARSLAQLKVFQKRRRQPTKPLTAPL